MCGLFKHGCVKWASTNSHDPFTSSVVKLAGQLLKFWTLRVLIMTWWVQRFTWSPEETCKVSVQHSKKLQNSPPLAPRTARPPDWVFPGTRPAARSWRSGSPPSWGGKHGPLLPPDQSRTMVSVWEHVTTRQTNTAPPTRHSSRSANQAPPKNFLICSSLSSGCSWISLKTIQMMHQDFWWHISAVLDSLRGFLSDQMPKSHKLWTEKLHLISNSSSMHSKAELFSQSAR